MTLRDGMPLRHYGDYGDIGDERHWHWRHTEIITPIRHYAVTTHYALLISPRYYHMLPYIHRSRHYCRQCMTYDERGITIFTIDYTR